MNAPTLLSPHWWRNALMEFDTSLHLIDTNEGVLINTSDVPDTLAEHAAPPVVQIAALWSGVETHVTATRRPRHPGGTMSLLDFATTGVCGDVRRLVIHPLHLRINLFTDGDAIITSTAPASTHLRLARAHILSSWQHRMVWPSPIIPQLLARHRELGIPPLPTSKS